MKKFSLGMRLVVDSFLLTDICCPTKSKYQLVPTTALEQVLACKETILSTGTVVVSRKSLNKTVIPSDSGIFIIP